MDEQEEERTMEEARIVKCEQWGRYTIAQATTEDGIKGVGISRRSFNDKKNDELGSRIACGRAMESIRRKKASEYITNNFMG